MSGDDKQTTPNGLPRDLSHGKKRIRRSPRWYSNAWPYVVWLLLCVCVYFLYSRSARFGGMTGVVETIAEPIAPLETARLIEITVNVGSIVKQGDVIAKLDTALLDARLALDGARMLEAESTITGYQQNILQLVRQFDSAIKAAETQLAVENQRYDKEKAELEELEIEMARREELFKKRMIDEASVVSLKPRIAALQTSMQSYPPIIESLESQLKSTKEQRKDIDKWLRADGNGDISSAITKKMAARNSIFKANRDQAELRRSFHILRAARDGVVSRIFHQPGDVIGAGEPIVRIVQETSKRIIGFLPENFLTDVFIGQEVHCFRAHGPVVKREARVTSIGAEVLALPGRLSPIQAQPLRGRRVVIEVQGESDYIPGETIKIRRIPISLLKSKS